MLAFVQRQAAAEEGNEPPTDQWDLDNTYVSEPTLRPTIITANMLMMTSYMCMSNEFIYIHIHRNQN